MTNHRHKTDLERWNALEEVNLELSYIRYKFSKSINARFANGEELSLGEINDEWIEYQKVK